MSWTEWSPAFSPFFRASAWSKDSESCFWIASVYWLPPKEMSRQKIVFAPDRMLTFVTEAPDVDQGHDPARLDRVVRLVGVLEGEGVDVDEHRRLARPG